jgi:hypothetical protein
MVEEITNANVQNAKKSRKSKNTNVARSSPPATTLDFFWDLAFGIWNFSTVTPFR